MSLEQKTGWIDEELERQVLEDLPVKRLGFPKDIAHTVSFLVNENALWITGQIIKVSGGHNIRQNDHADSNKELK
jgi:Dehydrogenases with different specificities (related to short-chain alcohol dehydrogenases)